MTRSRPPRNDRSSFSRANSSGTRAFAAPCTPASGTDTGTVTVEGAGAASAAEADMRAVNTTGVRTRIGRTEERFRGEAGILQTLPAPHEPFAVD
ncbi:hypothetical protein GCM10008956_16040 [Deinococcus arenae]|uniref:Uncharacterized protein n=1 Tax=Deinococcus arenae TaxID=1452751 RepID=A0A8H9GNZ4_9DEIO|nr:hypothetical protein GCM10008956_16040 [Deinococcus arenae]